MRDEAQWKENMVALKLVQSVLLQHVTNTCILHLPEVEKDRARMALKIASDMLSELQKMKPETTPRHTRYAAPAKKRKGSHG